MLLAGDVGGTKTSLGLFDESRPGTPRVAQARVASREAGSLEAAVDEFLGAHGRPRIDAACFGVAGVVVDGRVAATNLPWQLDERDLVRAIPTRRVRLLNDLEAAGYGVLLLRPAELAELQPGQPREGNKVLIAAGTGLGQALLIWQQGHHHVVASEGGHGDFAPGDELQARLLAHLRREHGHVSYEHVLSGPGLVAVYRFLRHDGPAEPAWLTAELSEDDQAKVISEAALERRDPVCAAALDLFVSVYGAEAGNLALKAVAVGGVIVGGGIAPKILSALSEGAFIRAFRDKGRMAKLMADIPVRVALNVETSVLGAASVARGLLAEG
jgi:glucokinase